jgi:hypothetical protein
MPIRHVFISNKTDSSDTTVINPSDWNEDHEFTENSNPLQLFRRTKNPAVEEYEFSFPSNNIRVTTDYDFAPITSAVALVNGTVNTVTFAFIPLGVNGNNVDHYLLIQDSIGGNEVVKIVGGTGIAGAGGGTLSFTPSIFHIAGNWTIKSATAGISEAYWALWYNRTDFYGKIEIPAGVFTIHAPFSYYAEENFRRFAIVGQGSMVTTLQVSEDFPLTAEGVFVCKGPHVSYAPIYSGFIIQAEQPWGTGVANYTHWPPFFYTQGPCRGVLEDIIICGAWVGIHQESIAAVSDASGWTYRNCYISAYSIGLNLVNNYDTVRITNCHFWPWIPVINAPVSYQQDSLDASCIAIKVNRTDHLVISDSLFWIGTAFQITGGGQISVTNCMLDAFSYCDISNCYMIFVNCFFTLNNTMGSFSAFGPSIDLKSGSFKAIGCQFAHYSPNYPPILLRPNVSGTFSMVSLNDNSFHCDLTDAATPPEIHINYPGGLAEGATCQIVNNRFYRNGAATYTNPIIKVEDGTKVRVTVIGNTTSGSNSGSKIFITCAEDNWHIIKDNSLIGYTVVYPSVRLYGVYEDSLYTFPKQSIVFATGKGPRFTEGGVSPVSGEAALVAGTKIVATTAMAAASRILITPIGVPAGRLHVSVRTPGVSFTVASTDSGDTTTFHWVLFNNV